MDDLFENSCEIGAIMQDLRGFLLPSGSTQLDYCRYLLVDKAPYLDAFIQGKDFPPFEVEMQMSSRCNLRCRWCIGDEVQTRRRVLHLPNNITADNVGVLIRGLTSITANGLSVETVKFSGFIGEPLGNKATLHAMVQLKGDGRRVGLFTNGVLMGPETWWTLGGIDYVHVSLDAGPSSFFWLKEDSRPPREGQTGRTYTTKTFYAVLENIKGLSEHPHRQDELRINVGYVVVPGNHQEIYETVKLVKDAGADSIRFKCDIGGRHPLSPKETTHEGRGGAGPETAEDGGGLDITDGVFAQIARARADFANGSFQVQEVHSKDDVRSHTYEQWSCKRGCYFQKFFGTIGSDGNAYLCDHNTTPAGVSLGNCIDEPFGAVWKGEQRRCITEHMDIFCRCNVCPPFANRVNPFLARIAERVRQGGSDRVQDAVNQLRQDLASNRC